MRSLKRHDLIWTVGLAAGTAAFVLLVVRPQFNRVRELKEALRTEQRLLAEGRSDLVQLPRLQVRVNDLRREVGGFEDQVPLHDDLGQYLKGLAAAAEQNALRPEAIEPGSPVRLSEMMAVPIVLKVQGPFKDVYALLKDIEALPRLTQIERFDAQIVPDRPGEVQTEMQLRVFYRAS